MIRMEDNRIVIRELAEADAGILLKWLTDPCVLEFYEGRDRPFTEALIREHFYNREDPVTGCMVEYEGTKAGYIQFYPLEADEMRAYGYALRDGALFGIDQFIGEPSLWGKGLGRKFIKRVLRFLVEDKGADLVVLDPHADNLRAIRCYEACGFETVKLLSAHELHEGTKRDCYLMEYRARKHTKETGKEGLTI